MNPPGSSTPPVFLDPSGKRWRFIRRTALVLGALTTLAGGAIVAGILIPPLLPALTQNFHVKRNLTVAPHLATTRKDRERLAAKRRLFVALERRRPALGVKTPFLPVRPPARKTNAAALPISEARAPPAVSSSTQASSRG